ncbi:MAG: exo-beta-N-acetylmuramidase NamZ domain-containing protein [Dysgonomonas sp.]
MKRLINITLLFLCTLVINAQDGQVITGAESINEYLPLIKGKRVALVSNHTGMIKDQHVVDILVKENVNVTAIFSPEHGFRGNADAGEHVASSVDKKTGIPIRSLYDGKSRKPSKQSMELFDVLLFDIQDVGLRFYTYYITMFRLMDVCAEYNKTMIILDRPNPNGHYVDGPIMDMKYKSGVGYLPIPVVHGMTLGELALMINGEGWLPELKKCDVTIIKCKNYTHKTMYQLPIAPSPNLPNMKSIYLYPSTCLFEGTPVSLGRGTSYPFQVYGHPQMKGYTFSFTPKSIPGAKNPPLLNQKCFGVDLRNIPDENIYTKGINLSYIIDAYKNLKMGNKFFTSFFENLIGVDYVRKMIVQGKSADEIKKMWKDDVEKFKQQRKPYLLYEE